MPFGDDSTPAQGNDGRRVLGLPADLPGESEEEVMVIQAPMIDSNLEVAGGS